MQLHTHGTAWHFRGTMLICLRRPTAGLCSGEYRLPPRVFTNGYSHFLQSRRVDSFAGGNRLQPTSWVIRLFGVQSRVGTDAVVIPESATCSRYRECRVRIRSCLGRLCVAFISQAGVSGVCGLRRLLFSHRSCRPCGHVSMKRALRHVLYFQNYMIHADKAFALRA